MVSPLDTFWGLGSSTAPPPAVFLGWGPRGGRSRGIPRLRLTCFSSGSGHIKEVIVAAEPEPGDSEMAEVPDSPGHQGPRMAGQGEQAQVKLLVNEDGRYVCALCHKTFKTVSRGPRAMPARRARPPAQGGF